eukprot:6098969-Heterocapsa_arctica.AAC.1
MSKESAFATACASAATRPTLVRAVVWSLVSSYLMCIVDEIDSLLPDESPAPRQCPRTTPPSRWAGGGPPRRGGIGWPGRRRSSSPAPGAS